VSGASGVGGANEGNTKGDGRVKRLGPAVGLAPTEQCRRQASPPQRSSKTCQPYPSPFSGRSSGSL
jgi:hypothetical protein